MKIRTLKLSMPELELIGICLEQVNELLQMGEISPDDKNYNELEKHLNDGTLSHLLDYFKKDY